MESKQVTFALWLMILISAFAIIKSSYNSRVLFIEWQDLLEKSQMYEVEWGQLLIEKSTLASYANLENMAKEELKMIFPARKQIVVVQEKKQ